MAHAAKVMPNHIVIEVVEAGWAPFVTVDQPVEGGSIRLTIPQASESAWTKRRGPSGSHVMLWTLGRINNPSGAAEGRDCGSIRPLPRSVRGEIFGRSS